MSGFSATAKNFAVTVAIAVGALGFEKAEPALLWAGAVAVIAFLLMDGYYHLLEVRFRELYRTTAVLPIEAGSDMLLDAPKGDRANVWKVLTSATLLPFYVLLLFVLGIVIIEVNNVHAAKLETVAVAARDDRESISGRKDAPPERAGGPEQVAKADDKRTDRPVGAATPTKGQRAGDAR